MNINSINNINFSKVYGIYGTTKNIAKTYTSALKANQQSPNIMFMPATDIYKANAGDGTLTKAAHEGKEVALFITGGKDCNKATFMEKGWSTVNSISQHIAKTFNADNLSSLEKEEIYSSME